MFSTTLLIKYPEVLTFDDFYGARLYYESEGLSERDINKLFAAAALVKTDFFWTKFHHFCYLCRAIDEGVVTNVGYLWPDLDNIGWAIVEAVVLTPEINDCRFIDGNIQAYILFLAEKHYYLPFTLIPFLGNANIKKYVDNEKSIDANNFLVLQMRNYISAIKTTLKEVGQELTVVSMDDLEKRILLFRSVYNGDLEITEQK
ncbi:MAG: hypothetical protein RMJ16_13860 [Thermoguttaceae bacterium]|nr:hypothetical protein [Thermoguttaceae bacterium]